MEYNYRQVEKTIKCSKCGMSIPIGSRVYEVNEYDKVDSYCRYCFEELFDTCCGCSDLCYIGNMIYSDLGEQYYCEDCYYETFMRCESCGQEIYTNDAYLTNSGAFCEDCYNHGSIHTHDYWPELNFYGNGTLYFGIELEVENNGHEDKREIAADIQEKYPFIFVKGDGSLSNGFEIVTHPMNWDYIIKNANQIIELLSYLKKRGFTSYDTRTCGIHIHMSKKAVGNFQLYKFLKFFYENKPFILKISQRAPDLLDEWASLRNQPLAQRKKIARIKQDIYGSRYSAVNCQNDDTIEVRIFRGTLNPSSFFKNIEFLHALYLFTLDYPIKDMKPEKFIAYVSNHKKDYCNLHAFLGQKEQT